VEVEVNNTFLPHQRGRVIKLKALNDGSFFYFKVCNEVVSKVIFQK
jgi:hypothetical protein